MSSKILIINGHPDAGASHLCSALADAYDQGCRTGGHAVRRLKIADLTFAVIRSREIFEATDLPVDIAAAQIDMLWADHIVIIHPLWLGTAPALLKAFLEQTFRYGFALPKPGSGARRGQLAGRSARIIVTMGMPGPIYRIVFGGFGIRTIARGILAICGVRPARITYIGNVESLGPHKIEALFNRMRKLGRLAV